MKEFFHWFMCTSLNETYAFSFSKLIFTDIEKLEIFFKFFLSFGDWLPPWKTIQLEDLNALPNIASQ